MPAPLFSVVIPTRNRPDYVADAVASTLLQDIDSLECIVSDNSDDDRTLEVMAGYVRDPRCQYYRPPRVLPMLDHWEFASSKASGEILLMLSDRKLLCRGALRRIHRALEQRPNISAFSVASQVYDDAEKHLGWRSKKRRTRVYETSDLVEHFLRENIFDPTTLDPVFPKTHNGGLRRQLAERIRAATGHLFNNPRVTTPDYSAFFETCAVETSILHIGARLILTQGERTSNGRLFGAGATTAYLGELAGRDLYAAVPFKEPFIYNLLMADYLAIRDVLGRNLRAHAPDWLAYFRTLYEEYRQKRKVNALAGRSLDELFAKWSAACDQALGSGVAASIVEESERARSRRPALSNPLPHVRDFLNHRLGDVRLVNWIMSHRFPSALEAAGFDVASLREGWQADVHAADRV